ncbi:MAG: MBL fold metallo-hydrolase [Dehalococcoidia bacterium]
MPNQLADGVYSIGRDRIEVYAIEEGGRLTLVDSGLKSDWDHINAEVAALGKTLHDIEAVLLTHAHADHMGCAERLRSEAGAHVQVHSDDLDLATGKAKPPRDPKGKSMLSYGLPLFITLFQFVRKGAASAPPPLVDPATFNDGEVLDLPGRPKVVHVPGHTHGSAAFHLPERRVLFTGDALVSYNFYTRKAGAQISPSPFNADSQQALSSLKNLEGLDASIVLPGHGAPMPDLGEAIAAARRHGTDAKP